VLIIFSSNNAKLFRYTFQIKDKLIGDGKSSYAERKSIPTIDSRNVMSLSNWDRS